MLGGMHFPYSSCGKNIKPIFILNDWKDILIALLKDILIVLCQDRRLEKLYTGKYIRLQTLA